MQVLFGDTRKKSYLEIMQKLNIGRMCIRDKPNPYKNENWGFDNGSYSYFLNGIKFNENEYLRRFEKAYKIKNDPYIAVLPDIVAGGELSLDFSLKWLEQLPKNWNWYLAIQDGMSFISVENALKDKEIKGIFLGGTDNFKGRYGLIYRQLADKMNKKYHFGRAGTLRRIRYVKELNCDSFDSAFPLWTEKRFNTIIILIKNNFEYTQQEIF